MSLERENDYYREYLLHKCLYYKHTFPVIGDQDFDHFEKEYFSLYPGHILCDEMCDWDPSITRTAYNVDRLPLRAAQTEVRKLMHKRKTIY